MGHVYEITFPAAVAARALLIVNYTIHWTLPFRDSMLIFLDLTPKALNSFE